MALASLEDINIHLPDDKLEVDAARYARYQLDAERIVRGYLAGYYSSSTLAKWTDPDSTPELIRAIAGRLVAAFYYRQRYSEDSLDDPQYAQVKYNEAIGSLQGIINGTMTLGDESDVAVSGNTLTNLDFYPNNSAPGPIFTMDMPL